MKRTIILLALLLFLSAFPWAYAAPFAVCAQPVTQSATAPEPSASLESIFAVPEWPAAPGAVAKDTYACAVQTRCPSGLYIGCQSYTDPNGCEVVPGKCLMCDGQIYRCNGVACPF